MQHVNITDDVITSICEFVRTGTSFRDAYLLAGVNKYTGRHWRAMALKDIRADKSPSESVYIKLSQAMDKAKATYIRSLVDCVNLAGKDPKNWQAAMTLMERRDPETYSRFTRLKSFDELGINPQEDSPIEIISKVLTAILDGKLSTKEGEQMANIIGTIVKTDENTEVKSMLAQAIAFRDALKEGKK